MKEADIRERFQVLRTSTKTPADDPASMKVLFDLAEQLLVDIHRIADGLESIARIHEERLQEERR